MTEKLTHNSISSIKFSIESHRHTIKQINPIFLYKQGDTSEDKSLIVTTTEIVYCVPMAINCVVGRKFFDCLSFRNLGIWTWFFYERSIIT